jgi:hypothetical protein
LAWKILILFICQTQKKITKEKLNIFNSISFVVKTAFSNPIHIIIGSITGIVFWVVTNMFDNILFFSPFLAFHVPSDMLGIFLLSCVNSILVGILVNFSLHMLSNLKLKFSKSALSGTTASIVSSTCASCSTFAFSIASIFGGLGFAISDFLVANQTIIREISTLILLFAVYTNYTKIRNSCKLPYKHQIRGKSGK